MKIEKKPLEKIDFTDLFENSTNAFELGSKELVLDELIKSTKISPEICKYIYWFYPTIIFKLLFPRLNFEEKNSYKIIYRNGKSRFFPFKENQIYNELLKYLQPRYENFTRRKLLKILEHSVEFGQLNRELNSGKNLNEIVVLTFFRD